MVRIHAGVVGYRQAGAANEAHDVAGFDRLIVAVVVLNDADNDPGIGHIVHREEIRRVQNGASDCRRSNRGIECRLQRGAGVARDYCDWLDAQATGGYWANPDTFKDVVSAAANSIWPGWGATLSFSSEPAWAEIVAPALAAGKTIASVAEEWQTRYKNDAQVNGYTVK